MYGQKKSWVGYKGNRSEAVNGVMKESMSSSASKSGYQTGSGRFSSTGSGKFSAGSSKYSTGSESKYSGVGEKYLTGSSKYSSTGSDRYNSGSDSKYSGVAEKYLAMSQQKGKDEPPKYPQSESSRYSLSGTDRYKAESKYSSGSAHGSTMTSPTTSTSPTWPTTPTSPTWPTSPTSPSTEHYSGDSFYKYGRSRSVQNSVKAGDGHRCSSESLGDNREVKKDYGVDRYSRQYSEQSRRVSGRTDCEKKEPDFAEVKTTNEQFSKVNHLWGKSLFYFNSKYANDCTFTQTYIQGFSWTIENNLRTENLLFVFQRFLIW